jgi:phosphatidylglycerophosphatase A
MSVLPSPAVAPSEAHPRTAWAWLAGTFFGIGLVGKGGGTIASIATVLIWWLAAQYLKPATLVLMTAVAALAATVLGIYAAGIVAREIGKKDPSEVVLDEVAGQLIALIAIPLDWKYVLASLILFRGFDIVKPPPVRQLERVSGGAGIMLDDVAAGLYALAFAHVLVRLHLFS